MTLEIITSDNLGQTRHGFFTRRGGRSSGVYQGLNCGFGSSDQKDAVQQNRALVADAMNAETENLRSVYQIHSADVLTVGAESAKDVKADAMVTNTQGIALGILTADCAPILFSDEITGVVGAAHSGWQGALKGIATQTIEAMESLGAQLQNIRATVGPCISQKNYEVGEEFLENFIIDDPSATRFFANGAAGKYQFDLPSFCLSSLRDAGVKSAEWTGHCTYAEPDRFYSYRRSTHLNEPDYGRLISVIKA
jgi:YfiH family protein